jgi:hypothetical protein
VSLLYLCIVLVVVGVVLWAVTTYVPMQPAIKRILVIVVVIAVVLFVLRAFGVLSYIERVRI